MTKHTCPKCSGTGFVAAFAHVKNGFCFDCDGTGKIEVQVTGNLNLRKARVVGDAVLAGKTVDTAEAQAAWDFYEDLGPCRWSQKDYDRRNTLGRTLGLIY